MNPISCGYSRHCRYRSGDQCTLPGDWDCEYQYERIPLDQMMMEDTGVHDIHDMDRDGNS